MSKCPHCGGEFRLSLQHVSGDVFVLTPVAGQSTGVRAPPGSLFDRVASALRHTGPDDDVATYEATWQGAGADDLTRIDPPKPKAQLPAPLYEEEWRPARQLNVEADVTVIVRWAVIWAGIAFIGTLVVLAFVKIAHPLELDPEPGVLLMAPLAAFVAFAVVFRDGVRTSKEHIWRHKKTPIPTPVVQMQSPPRRRDRSRTVIEPQSAPMPEVWDDLDEADKVADVHRFAEIVWQRQQAGIQANGQKELRGTPLPSGFTVNDGIHKAMLQDLKDAGVIRYQGRLWTLEAPPQVVKRRVRAEEW